MKKRELIYLHSLLVEVRRDLEARGDLPAEAFDDYEALGVGATSVHRTKGEHREAVVCLLEGLTAALAARRSADEDADLSADH